MAERLERSVLLAPASNWKMLQKTAASQADAVCIDLEDAVAVDEKEASRENIIRAYTELELTGLVETQMGSGTFISHKKVTQDDVERRRLLDQICQEILSRASSYGFSIGDILENLKQRKRS